MSGWTTEKLVEVLKEQDWWPRYKAQREAGGFNVEKALSGLVADRAKEEFHYVPEVRPLRREMIALVAEIESGEIYGSASRCAICSGKADTFMCGVEHAVHVCYGCCERFSSEGCNTSAAAILRARRILSDRTTTTKKAPTDGRVDPYATQRLKEEKLGFGKMQEGQWGCALAGGTLEAVAAWLREERQASQEVSDKERRHRVLLGFERGPDPRLILAGDLWDPRRRP